MPDTTASVARIQELLAVIPAALLLFDRTGHCVAVNDEARALLNLSEGEFIGWSKDDQELRPYARNGEIVPVSICPADALEPGASGLVVGMPTRAGLIRWINVKLSSIEVPHELSGYVIAACTEARYEPQPDGHTDGTLSGEEIANLLQIRDLQILSLVGQGCTNKRIGAALHLSAYTVRDAISELMIRFGATNRTELARAAWARGLLGTDGNTGRS